MARPRTTKHCWYHKKRHPLEAFAKNAAMPDGLEKMCREGRSEYRRRKAIEDHPERFPDPIPYDELKPKYQAMLQPTTEAFCAFFEEFSGLGAVPRHAVSWMDAHLREDNLVLNVPSRHAKTTIMAEWNTIWELARNRQAQILLLSKTQPLAVRSCRRIASILEFNVRLNRAFGRFRPEDRSWPWSVGDGNLMVAGRDRETGTGDLSLQCRGSQQQVLGMEATKVIGDDVTDRKVAQSEAERIRELEWFRGECLSRLMPEGKALLIGQRVHPMDIYAAILSPDEEEDGTRAWAHEISPAVLEFPSEGKPAKVLWPEQRPWKWLNIQRRRLGSDLFAAYFQQAPVGDSGAMVRPEWIPGCLDGKRDLGQARKREHAFRTRVVSVDPSPSRYAGFVVADLIFEPGNPLAELDIIDIRREFDIGTDKMVAILADLQLAYGCDACVVETNSLRIVMKDTIWQSLAAIFDNRVIRHSTTASSKQHEKLGLWTMRSMWEFGRLHLPYGTARAQEAASLLVEEALGQVATTDVLMALWFIYYNMLGLKGYAPGALPTRFKSPQGPGIWGRTHKM